MKFFPVVHCAFALLVMDIRVCKGTPMRSEVDLQNKRYENQLLGSSEYAGVSFEKSDSDDIDYWQSISIERDSLDISDAPWDYNLSPASSIEIFPTVVHDFPTSTSDSYLISPVPDPHTPSTPPSLGPSPSSAQSSSSAPTPPSRVVTSPTAAHSPRASMTSAAAPHAGEHLHWLLKQEQRRHPWQAPASAPRAIQEALDAYKRTEYETFCQNAMVEDEEPLRVTDGSFHPKFEMVPTVGVYRFHATPASWEDARAACEDEGAQIAIANSFQEAKILAEIHNRCPFILDTHFNDYQFLGAHDIFGEGDWETITGDKLNETGYLRWGYGQPDNAHFKGENCLAMNRYGFFNDVPCWVKLPFICEHA